MWPAQLLMAQSENRWCASRGPMLDSNVSLQGDSVYATNGQLNSQSPQVYAFRFAATLAIASSKTRTDRTCPSYWFTRASVSTAASLGRSFAMCSSKTTSSPCQNVPNVRPTSSGMRSNGSSAVRVASRAASLRTVSGIFRCLVIAIELDSAVPTSDSCWPQHSFTGCHFHAFPIVYPLHPPHPPAQPPTPCTA